MIDIESVPTAFGAAISQLGEFEPFEHAHTGFSAPTKLQYEFMAHSNAHKHVKCACSTEQIVSVQAAQPFSQFAFPRPK